MANMSQFAAANEIRAVLGVTPEEIEDSTLAMPLYVRQLQFDLSDIDSTLEASYLSVAALSSRTVAEQKLYDVVQAFCPYSVARVLLTSVPLFAPKRITDGRAETERVVDPFSDVRDGVDAGYLSLRERVKSALTAYGSTVSIVSRQMLYSTSAGIAVNPVTNA